MTTCPACGRPHKGLMCAVCTPRRTPEENREYARRWRQKNPEKVKARHRARYQKHKASRALKVKAWQEAHKDKMKAYRKNWEKKNPEKAAEISRRQSKERRARIILREVPAAKPLKPSPKISALLKLAEVKAIQALYGIQRISFQEQR